jgi:predicted O-methyltransferase YrrM
MTKILNNLQPLAKTKKTYLNLVTRYVKHPGDWLEFGVYEGRSSQIFLNNMTGDSKLYLFDSFEGLPEDWGDSPAGTFACEVPVFESKRAKIVKGFFEDTLPEWSKTYNKTVAVVHIDCDLYSSCQTVFRNINHLIAPNTLVLLDDYAREDFHFEHTYKAFHDYLDEFGKDFYYIARTEDNAQAAVRVINK